MKRPDVDNIWEFAIRIPYGDLWKNHIDTLRLKVIPAITILKNRCKVKWFSFARHNNINGIPIDYDGNQFHIKFENSRNFSKNELIKKLPNYCEKIGKLEKEKLKAITGIHENYIKNNDLTIARKFIGEFCELIINIIKAYNWDSDFSYNECRKEIRQYLHYIKNMTTIEII